MKHTLDTKKKYAINLTLFKIIGFYQMVDPNVTKLFGYNIYNCIHTICIIFTSTMTLIGLSGFVFKGKDSIEYGFKDMQMLFYIACITCGNLKLIIIISNTKKIWNLFNVAHESFLTSKYCKNDYYKLVDSGVHFARIFPWYFFLFFMTAFSWVTLPKIIDYHNGETNLNQNTRRNNVVNLRFPISVKTYNEHFDVIYVLESILCSYGAYGLVTFDLFLIALLQLIAIQYEIVSCAYENLEFTAKNEEGGKPLSNKKIRDDFVSITEDRHKIYEHLETLYYISRPVVLIYMVGDAVGMITLPYSIVMCYVQNGSMFSSDVLTFLWTLFVAVTQSFILCNLFQHVNETKEAVNFGIFSCDWTRADIRIKKLMLLAMRVDSSNNLKMKITQTKLIDLPMLATIVRSSYSITSVLINSNIDKIDAS